MPPLSREDVENVLAKFAERNLEFAQETAVRGTILDGAEKLGRVFWFFGSIVAAVALWTGKMQWDHGNMARQVEVNRLAVDKLNELRIERGTTIQTIENTIVGNRMERIGEIASIRADIARQQAKWDKWEDVIHEMSAMRDRGESNRQYFKRKHGFSAPQAPE